MFPKLFLDARGALIRVQALSQDDDCGGGSGEGYLAGLCEDVGNSVEAEAKTKPRTPPLFQSCCWEDEIQIHCCCRTNTCLHGKTEAVLWNVAQPQSPISYVRTAVSPRGELVFHALSPPIIISPPQHQLQTPGRVRAGLGVHAAKIKATAAANPSPPPHSLSL